MIVRLAYSDDRVRCCRAHYDYSKSRPDNAPPLGPVEDARESHGCEYCDAERETQK